MEVILGIDTGGTYTDGVIIDYVTKKVVRGTKSFTTKDSLIVGIRNCIDGLKIREEEKVCLVCLSTTLATNAVVEGNGAEVGLITIGATTEREYPVKHRANLRGKIDIMGREIDVMQEKEVRHVLSGMKGNIDTLAISGQASVKNPMHELYVKKIADEILGIPVVCAHEISNILGFFERTTTAILNARLIPTICELLADTKAALADRNMDAPIMIVKGDGHSMIGNYAESFPVETVLSGPAASLVGGKFLIESDNALIVDMGGTTTDIVSLENGEAVLDNSGMYVGGWRTQVSAVRVHTFGLGGDSRLNMNSKGEMVFGPKKVIPLCVAAAEYPYLKDELKTYRLPDNYFIVKQQDTDCLKLFKDRNCNSKELTDNDKELLSLLQDGPHAAAYIAEALETDIDSLNIEKLVDMELIQLISMTPTDVLHALGEYDEWSVEAADIGAELLAGRAKKDKAAFLKSAEDKFINQICRSIIESLCSIDGLPDSELQSKTLRFILDNAFCGRDDENFTVGFHLNKPIAGVGAPAAAWVKRAADRLGAEFILPEYSYIANAVGAAVGDVRETMEALIQYDSVVNEYAVYLPGKRAIYKTLEIAKEESENFLHNYAEELADRLGMVEYEINIDTKDCYIENVCTGEDTFMKSTLTATLRGKAV